MRLAATALIVGMFVWAAPGCATQKQSSIEILKTEDVSGWIAGAGLQCRGGVWALVNESESSSLGGLAGATKTRPFEERLFFCCPMPGEPPVCRRARWEEGGAVAPHPPKPAPSAAAEPKVVPTAPPQPKNEEAPPGEACAELCRHYVDLVEAEGLEVGSRAKTCISECPKWSARERHCAREAATLGAMRDCLGR
ncbi:MAG: hypothetical protein EP329_18600 [Deltaproteobacteria bacterium]|nr:MAG: hypothetical protein EP329_18600 [Deltaproteobacteria bacterium]